MQVGNSLSFVAGPLFALACLALLIVILRWAFRRGASVVAPPSRPGSSDDYGLLVPIARPATYVEGEIVRRRLEDRGIRANLAHTLDGPRIMVWPADEGRAREALRQGSA